MLDTIHQAGKLADIDKSNEASDVLAWDSKHDDTRLRFFHKKALHPVLKGKVNNLNQVPKTLNEWQKAVVQKYNNWKWSKPSETRRQDSFALTNLDVTG
ncbi:hypothetical protein PQX77_017705 [Marasmius sp. AFHP31]|nr:hypothetical protein PQX77_017705 [Marasmius sp. AFHP31]